MNLIVAVDNNWGIGCRGDLLQIIPEDMKYFKEKTMGKVVVMGRTTFESLPNKKPLKDRINIILTKNEDYAVDGAIICHSLDELFERLKDYDHDDIYIIGGESIYTLLLPYCSRAYVTKIKNQYEADTYFPNLDQKEDWELVEEGELKEYNNILFQFTLYENLHTLKMA
ncbi:dihydrofolate reductase [Defluviitalea saccharophila]|uniref:Dihydrofolate reductase n=1 Tax=Defluviitalea saccharophila TaxID=879970 RepID=A0ABZ2Y644_9FIRM|nr:dihydrofolate reductase [Candidatus Epulonipiscium sp.]